MFAASGDIVATLQAGKGWAMDLRFPSVFSEDVTMWSTIVGSLQAGSGWAMDLRFRSVFSEDVTMWMAADCHRWCPPGWQRMGDGSSLSLCIQ